MGPSRSWTIFLAHVLGDRLPQERPPFADPLHVDTLVLLGNRMEVAELVARRGWLSNFGSMFYDQPHPTLATIAATILQLPAKTHTHARRVVPEEYTPCRL